MIGPYELDSLDLQRLSAKVIRLEIEKELKRPEGYDRGVVIDWYVKLAGVAEASPRRRCESCHRQHASKDNVWINFTRS